MKIALAQINPRVGDIAANARLIIDTLVRARDELGADVVVFPELCLTGYPPEDLLLRPGLQRRVVTAMEQIVAATDGIEVIVGYPQGEQPHLHNAAAFIRNGRIVACCRKHHLPNYGVFDEKRYFVSGEGYVVAQVGGIKTGIIICEDAWHPEPMSKAVAEGAQLMVVLNASPFHCGKHQAREEILRQRAQQTGVPIVYVNMVGGQDELVFDGGSFVMDADGHLIHTSPAFEAALDVVEFTVEHTALVPLPGKTAPPLSEEATIYRALVCGVRDYIGKNGFNGCVIGLSGGIDSALTLAIAADAIGSASVEAVMMPSRYTADISRTDAAAQAEALGVNYRVIPIEVSYNAFIESLAETFAGASPDVTEENIQARCRGVLLMAISNKQHKMVLTTGNKSEMAVGYTTLYGDMAGGFAPLKDVPKCMVYRLAAYRNQMGAVIPQRVLERPPSAELAPDQKDEDSLPPYTVLDPILEMYVEQDCCAEEIVAAGFDSATVNRIIALVDRNEYKRRQAPPGVRISQRAFGRDRRYPITSGYSGGIR
ncbi:MAG: NAD+ synthase [Gammaproteobacteria bacterium]|nr:NAD+ synthase [Gammaproteobacteria bacterium]